MDYRDYERTAPRKPYFVGVELTGYLCGDCGHTDPDHLCVVNLYHGERPAGEWFKELG